MHGAAVDVLPLATLADGNHVKFCLPGSSIKGVLRTHAERIVRTLRGASYPAAPGTRSDFLEALKVHLVNELFGSTKRRGALTVEDCVSVAKNPRRRWADIISATDDEKLGRALHAAFGEASSIAPAYHVSVDRWTGGAADRRLFSELELAGVEWSAIRLRLDVEWLAATDRAPCQALLGLVIGDLEAGLLPLGYATRRGSGAVEVTNCIFRPANPLDSEDVKNGWARWLETPLETPA
jgi:CRISPR/Cas system CSM-associated protein Csm3 (group 7 of RAMP superfamily)